MKQLLKTNSIMADILGTQKGNSTACRPMKFCVKVELPIGTILYNCVTLEMIMFDPHENGLEEYLFSHWFLVPSSFNEKEWFNDIRLKIKERDATKPLHRFTIFTTTECNARCFYCYEEGVLQRPMSNETANDVADFIAKEYYGEPHRLHWFGGEPLCNISAIDIICRRLSEKDVKFSSTMTTNGYLFDETTVRNAVDVWRLKDVQITLDGTEKQYNRIKNYKGDDPNPFVKVLKNIALLLSNRISVKLRLNIGLYNIEDMLLLIDAISNMFGDNPYLSVYPALVDKYKYIYSQEEKIERNEQFRVVQQHLEHSGLHYKRKSIDNVLRITNCVGDDYRGCVILPDGQLSKCATLMDEEIYGSIHMHPNDYDRELIESWQVRGTEIPQCDDCCIYPLCSKRLYKCPSDRKNPIYDYECKTRIFDYISTIKSRGVSNI